MSELDAVSLVQAMSQTDTVWKEQAVRQVLHACDANSSLLVDLVPLFDDDAHKAMPLTCFFF